ncbi:DUF4230 domain-containing protein [Collinsella sp. HCP3S3_A7]|uniref:DUF4230 domain-containing protein n=1 Tax=unclassified Collinsella TaxID=2637548 RepID=UPI003F8C8619
MAALSLTGLSGCAKKDEEPDFSDYTKIAELATVECRFHNVAEIYNDGTNMLFGINVGYKKAWFEYDGTVQLGVDVSKVDVSRPDENNVVTITVPNAQILGQPQADESTFSDIYSDTGLLTPITTVDQSAALEEAQNEMIKSAEGNSALMNSARERAKTLLSQYVTGIGERMGEKYEVQFKDAE